MYVSRLPFHVLPGRTSEVEQRLRELRGMINEAGGQSCRILRAHYGSDGQADVILEQEVSDLGELERQIARVTANPRFQEWSRGMSPLLRQAPKREAWLVAGDGASPIA